MDNTTIKTYNLLAKTYDEETTDFWAKFPKTILDKFKELTQGKVLDIGSGPGRDALLLREKGLEVTCLDASVEMVKMCKEKGFTSIAADFTTLPFESESFDGVWAYTSLLHTPKVEIQKPFAEIKRVLKPKGCLGLGFVEGEWEGYRESSEIKMPRWFSYYTKLEIESLLSEIGFEIIYFNQFKPASKNYLNFIARKG